MTKYLCFLALIAAGLHAQESSSRAFHSEILAVDENLVHVISSFDEIDYFSTYSCSGTLVWEIPFGAKIVSWKMGNDDQLFILSKSRNGLIFYLTCAKASTGELTWEKSIYSPEAADRLQAQ